jgi:energy-coupling factor transporter ATP-binding protein EcfA2
MKLADAWIHGYRRFGGATPHRLRGDAKLVCLIGANEVGKSTILAAMELAQGQAAVEPADRSRGEAVPDDLEVVRLRYRLDDADRQSIAHVPSDADPHTVRWLTVVHRANGTGGFSIEPALRRVRAPRRSAHERLTAAAHQWWSGDDATEEEDETQRPDRDRIDDLIEALSPDAGTLVSDVITRIREVADEVDSADEALATELRALADHESAQHPTEAARDILWNRCPEFVRFDEEARSLGSEYDLNATADNPGAALRNLAALADLNLPELRDLITRGETGTVRDRREAANAVLKQRFAAWQQRPPVTVTLENDGHILRIHVQSGTGATMPFHERSDGLRQFVALVALTAQKSKATPPVLLIDEIETHLHYDAQADLVAVLAEQTATVQVIYSTHSAACLPEDLGLGVRVVEPIAEQTASTIRQNFWRDQHPGMGALLMAMGAASLAWVPLRPAVIAEGGSDLVLLPSLLREAVGSDHLGYAVVPGSSSVPPERIAGLDLQGVRTAWVFDTDASGRSRRDHLIASNIDAERILLLSDSGDLEIEDLILPDTFCKAVAAYLDDVGGTAESFTSVDLPVEPCRRHDAIAAWCDACSIHPPGKVALANKVIEQYGSAPLLDPNHAERLRALHRQLAALVTA